jgi:hypothetical protein
LKPSPRLSQKTFELGIWVKGMELTIQLLARDVHDARRRIQYELGKGAVIVASPREVTGATSADRQPNALPSAHVALRLTAES